MMAPWARRVDALPLASLAVAVPALLATVLVLVMRAVVVGRQNHPAATDLLRWSAERERA
jgi:hypothetical protein